MNLKKLRGKIAENNIFHKEIASEDCWNCALCSVSQKLRGVRPITLDEANAIGDKLKLTAQEYYEIFFTH